MSIPANIAEGYGRRHKAEYNQFLSIAYGSVLELETYLLLARDLGLTDRNDPMSPLLLEVSKMLYRMLNPYHKD